MHAWAQMQAQKLAHMELRSSAVLDQERHMDRKRRLNAAVKDAEI